MFRTRRSFISALAGLATAAALIAAPGSAGAADYVPGQVIVGYAQQPTGAVTANVARATGTETTQVAPSPAPDTQVVKLKPGVTVTQALRKLRHQRGVAYAVPNYLAHASGSGCPMTRAGRDSPGVGATAVELPARAAASTPQRHGRI